MCLKFIHLRVHSQYSLGESSLNIQALANLAIEYNMPALAITDTNNMFGICEFSKLLAKNGIKPIIGMELTIKILVDPFNASEPLNVVSNNLAQPHTSTTHIYGKVVLLAKNKIGYLNLLKLHQLIYFNRNPESELAVDFSYLCKYSENLIILTGGNEGFLANVTLKNNQKLLSYILTELNRAFKDNLYIELNRYTNKERIYLEKEFLALAKEYNLPIVATGNPYFNKKEDYEANDILMCIGQGKVANDCDRYYLSKEQYFKNQDEMANLFSDLPEALENTLKIAQKCNFMVESNPPTLPSYQDGVDELLVLKQQVYAGLKAKLDKYITTLQTEKALSPQEISQLEKEYFTRLNFEIDVIGNMKFSGYFLIVADFINWAKQNDIPVGPGRGSGAGSLVAWALNITEINPLQFGLFFERFLNPERISMPDFDIDFCQQRRDEVINYVVNKYGSDKVAQIITFGSLQTRGALRDVGRVLGLPYASVDKICKRIPYGSPSSPITISRVIKEEKELSEDIKKLYALNYLFSIALKLENLYRNTSTHAAGIIISLHPLVEVLPLYQDDSSGDSSLPVVGFSMKHAEEVGLVKFDFLGLKTLTVINGTVKRIKEVQNITLNISDIPLKDVGPLTNLLASGKTLGIFQLESAGMREILVQLKPDKIEDIIAIISLYRPGPMENIPVYINRKYGKEVVETFHPLMDDILQETFGIMIYQEQVMQIAQKLAGYTLGQADLLRRAMGKKMPKEMEQQKSKFLEGALACNNIKTELASQIFEQMAKFAGYGFNKSHAAAYAFISWQTAYLKAFYPAEFIAESMTYDMNDADKIATLIEDAKEFNIKVLPPDINYADCSFVPFKDDNHNLYIRYSILAVKGTSKNLIEKVKEELSKNGKFTSIEDFLNRIPNSYLNKKQLEALIKSGSLDSLESNRGKLLKQVDTLLDFNNRVFKKGEIEQATFFEELNLSSTESLSLKDIPDLPLLEKLIEEASVLGFFMSGHPLSEIESYFKELDLIKYNALVKEEITHANLAVVVLKIKISKTRNNDKYLTLTCSDVSATFNIILFGKSFYKFSNMVEESGMYKIKIAARYDGTEAKLFVEELHPFSPKEALNSLNNSGVSSASLPSTVANSNNSKASGCKENNHIINNTNNPKKVKIHIPANKELLHKLKNILNTASSGGTEVYIVITFPNNHVETLKLSNSLLISSNILKEIQSLAHIVVG